MEYEKIITEIKESSGILDAMLALQKIEGFLSEDAIKALAKAFDMPVSRVFETATFYSMIRLQPAEGAIEVSVCRGAPCHVAGAGEVIHALESYLGTSMGSATDDGAYILKYVECQGQCQASPAILINGTLVTGVTPESIPQLLKGGRTS